MRTVRSLMVVASLAVVPLLSSVGAANAVETPYEQVGGGNGPCVITDSNTVTLSPGIGATFGPDSGVYTNCPK